MGIVNASNLMHEYLRAQRQTHFHRAELGRSAGAEAELLGRLYDLLVAQPDRRAIVCGDCCAFLDHAGEVAVIPCSYGYETLIPAKPTTPDEHSAEDVGSIGSDVLDAAEALDREDCGGDLATHEPALDLKATDDPPLGRVHFFGKPANGERELAHAFDAHSERDC